MFSRCWNDECSGCPSTSITDDIETVRKIITDNCWITIRDVAEDAGISFGSYQAIVLDILDMKCVSAKFVPNYWMLIKSNAKWTLSRVAERRHWQSRTSQIGYNWWWHIGVWIQNLIQFWSIFFFRIQK